MSKRPATSRDPELIAIERDLRAIDRKQSAIQAQGLARCAWLELQGNRLHLRRQARTQVVNEQAARDAGWEVQGSATA